MLNEHSYKQLLDEVFCDIQYILLFVCNLICILFFFQEAIESSFCYRIYLTEIDKEFESDTFFPTFDKNTYRLLRYLVSHCYCSFRGTCRKNLMCLKINLIANQGKTFGCTLVESDSSRDFPWLDSPCENRKLFEALINSLQRRCMFFPTLCCPLNQEVAWWPKAVTCDNRQY